MKSKLINWSILNNNEEKINDSFQENVFIKRDKINDNIQFHLLNNLFEFDFSGVKIIQCLNTNKFLRYLFDDFGDSLISINNHRIFSKNIVVISPLTRINDILNNKLSGDLNKYIKQNDTSNDIQKISNVISEIYNSQSSSFKNVTDIDLSRAELINYIDVKDEFINEDNIIDILQILKSEATRKLIIFNDIDYLPIKKCSNWFNNFDFLYIMNSFEKNWSNIKNYHEFSLSFDGERLNEVIINKIDN